MKLHEGNHELKGLGTPGLRVQTFSDNGQVNGLYRNNFFFTEEKKNIRPFFLNNVNVIRS